MHAQMRMLLLIATFARQLVTADSADLTLDLTLDAVGAVGTVTSNEYMGCTTSGCTVSKEWQVNGYCDSVSLTLTVVETDYDWASEYLDVSLNTAYFGVCEGLDSYNTHDWVTCTNINNIDVTSYFDLTSMSNTFQVTLDASSEVDIGGYSLNGLTYYVYALASLTCWPAATAYEYHNIDVSGIESVSESVNLGCTSSGCSVSSRWDIIGSTHSCQAWLITLAILETDFAGSLALVDIYIGGAHIGQCEGLDASNTYNWITCSNVVNLDISEELDTTAFDDANDYFFVTLDASDQVNSYPYNTYYLYANLTLTCLRPTAPAAASLDAEFGLVFNAPRDGISSDSQTFGCTSDGCNVAAEWEIKGYCEEMTLTLDIVETDFLETDEYLDVFINDIYLGQCDGLDEDDTDAWSTCTNIDLLDIMPYLDPNSFTNTLELILDASEEVNCCGYYENGTNYYVYANATISCVAKDLNSSTNLTWAPTPYPTESYQAGQNITNILKVNVSGYRALYSAKISDVVQLRVSGEQALYKADLSNVSDIITKGYQVLYGAKIVGVTTLEVHGEDALSSALIVTSLRNVSEENFFHLVVNGTSSAGYDIFCNASDICNIECVNALSCRYMRLHCQGSCYIDCNDAQDIRCPLVWGSWQYLTTMTPSAFPSSGPSMLPSYMPSDMPVMPISISPSQEPTVLIDNIDETEADNTDSADNVNGDGTVSGTHSDSADDTVLGEAAIVAIIGITVVCVLCMCMIVMFYKRGKTNAEITMKQIDLKKLETELAMKSVSMSPPLSPIGTNQTSPGNNVDDLELVLEQDVASVASSKPAKSETSIASAAQEQVAVKDFQLPPRPVLGEAAQASMGTLAGLQPGEAGADAEDTSVLYGGTGETDSPGA